MTILKSVLAVVGGIATFSLALLGMMAAGNALLGAEPEWVNRGVTTQLVWLAWNILSMMGGGYVTARLAPGVPVAHAVIMGTLQACFSIAAMLAVTDDVTPQWLWIGGIATTVPSAWAGARVRTSAPAAG